MYLIQIRRYVRPGKEQEFLRKYRDQKTDHPACHGETLTKLVDDSNLPEGLRNLFELKPTCINYLNIALWDDWASFESQCTLGLDDCDQEIELHARERCVLEVGGTDNQLFK
jgi:hypothetical protein